MLRILGSAKKLCDGLTRRDFLHVGGLGALGLGLDQFFSLRHSQAREQTARAADPSRPNFGKAKACILLFPYGSPPQHETFDPKPDAPADIQGEMKAIATNVPGLSICDHLPKIAGVMDRVTVVRSMTHPYPVHGVAYAVSGIPTYTPDIETRPNDSSHWPFIGSVVDFLRERAEGEARPEVPRNVGLPWLLNARADTVPLAGPYAAFLGQGYNPVWCDFDGQGTKIAPKFTEGQNREFMDPYMGTTPDGRFSLSASARLPDDVSLHRLGMRRSLLKQFDRSRTALESDSRVNQFDRHRQTALSLLTTSTMRAALDVQSEPDALRERYGMTLFGQACLAARRLVEAGAVFITVFWDCYGQFANGAWDTHQYHYPRLKDYLLPGFDLAYSALITDLDDRGLLDETLVLWMSEHGRTPRIYDKPGAGREHWSQAYSIALAGGGTARGKVVGATDPLGGEVQDNPISPKDILASTYYLLGIDPHATVDDRQGRPVAIAGTGRVRHELFG